ncbi:ATP-binding protein [Amycolatopsis sp. NPDC051373]|uniref:ATP-binding protein n=1 Tax=Amycolatopsis sp. NPDC051373 TaxID=3155801 RepID=UPI00344D5A25
MELEAVTLSLNGSVHELAHLRSWARKHLRYAVAEQVDDVIAVLDELASNALKHGAPPVLVRLRHRQGFVRVEVSDGSAELATPRTPTAEGGRGLYLIEGLSHSWGQRPSATGKTVWAETVLDVDPGR